MTAVENVKQGITHGRIFVNGRLTEAASGREIEVINPATGEHLASVPDCEAADVDRAVAAARASFEKKSWRGLDPSKKEAILWRFADLLEKHKEEVAALESLENGKTYSIAMPANLGRGGLGYFKIWDKSKIAKTIEGATVESVLKGKRFVESSPRWSPQG